MPKTISSDITQQKNRLMDASGWIWLLEIWVSNTQSVRVTPYTEDVTWNGNSYEAFPLEFSGLTETSENEQPTVTITVHDPTRQLATYVDDNNGLVDKTVVIDLVHADFLAAGTAAVEFQMQVTQTTVSADGRQLRFELGPLDVYLRDEPRHKFNRDHCRWRYGSDECGFDTSRPGATQVCSKTWDGKMGCTAKGDEEVAANLPRMHPARFGGFHSMPSL